MRLGTRLTCFFLLGLALVLVGFSAALYAMAAKHLNRQVDERLDSALNTLIAAAEVGRDGVEWEPGERSLLFGRRTLEGGFAWRVADERGTRIDGSAVGEVDDLLAQQENRDLAVRRAESVINSEGVARRVMTSRLDRSATSRDGSTAIGLSPGRHEALVLGVVASLAGVRDTLLNLALTLTGLSSAIWVLALGCGRWFCRMALRPVTAMAEAAHSIGGDDSTRRLPAPGTDDELEELGRSFNSLLDRLGDSLERQQRFTGDASHQLRTPLTAMLGQIDVALRQDRSSDEYRRVLTLVRSKTRHLCQIVEGLMFLSRADAEARRPELEPIEVNAWLRVHLATHPDAGRFDTACEPETSNSCRVRVHKPLLGELLDNLLDNAAKYGTPGKPIRVCLGNRGGEVTLSVSNEGQGIDQADLPHLFDPFFRTDLARARGSTGIGLGLSVAARCAAVFGGRIVADSAPEQGATFTLFLPEDHPP